MEVVQTEVVPHDSPELFFKVHGQHYPTTLPEKQGHSESRSPCGMPLARYSAAEMWGSQAPSINLAPRVEVLLPELWGTPWKQGKQSQWNLGPSINPS